MSESSTLLTIATPLRVERRAVRRGAGDRVNIVRSGMGPRSSTRAAAGGQLGATGALAVLGLAGGLREGMHAGDVVVASEVRHADGRVVAAMPAAPMIAGALRRLGLTVHCGPVVSTRSVAVGSTARRRLAASGAVAVDTESAWLVDTPEVAAGRPVAVVRVVSDAPGEPLISPRVVARGSRALRSLRLTVPAVEQWAAACAAGGREVRLASPRSFCAGVERAIDIVRRALDRYGAPVYVRRQIVHNAHVVSDLEQRGAVFVNELDEVPVGARAILAAHGVAPEVRQQASDRQLSVIDATCPLVAKVHQEIKRYAAADHDVILIGHGDHEEVVGSAGEAPDRVHIVADEQEAATVAVADPDRVAFVMQTTLAVDEAERIAGVLRGRFPGMRAPRHDDICYATSNRQQAVREIASGCDVVLVVGSGNSSNSLRLVEVAQRAGAAASYLVDDASQIEPAWLTGARTIGITAGASAPPHLVDEVVAALTGLGPTAVSETVAVTEDLRFTLPKEVS